MGNTQTTVVIGDSHADVAALGNWVENHVWVFLLAAFVAFVFHLFQKGGFAEKFLDYRTRSKELDAKKLDDLRAVTDILRRKYDRADPLLPFDDGIERNQ